MSKRNAKPKPLEEHEHSFEPAGLVLRLLPLVLLVAIVASLAVWIRPALRDRVGDSFEEPVRVEFAWPMAASNSTWLPRHEQRRLEEMVMGSVGSDPFDQISLEQTHALLMSSGWFDSDLRLRRRPDSLLEVSATWRTPAAVVRVGDREHLVGVGGELLALEYAAGRSWPVRVIEGVRAPIPRRSGNLLDYGGTWNGGAVQASIALLARLRGHSSWEHVAGVDVSEYQEHERLIVVTRQGGRIVWGAPPSSRSPGEVSDEDKLRRLARLLDDPAWVSAGMPRVEIYNARVVVHESNTE
ncbi:MAG: hypothetical protein ACF8GE_11915 [Phycisphaerales bacterium JB043]